MDDASTPVKPVRPAVPRWRKLLPLLGLVLLGWVLTRLDLAGMGAALRQIAPSAVVLACGLFAVNFFVKALRWHRLLEAQGIRVPGRVTFAAFMSGQFYAQVTLGRVGEFFRVEALLERGVSAGAALASSIFDRLLDLFVVLAVGGVLAALVIGDMRVAALSALVMVGVGGGLRALLKALGAEQAPLADRALSSLAQRPGLARIVRGVRDLARGIDPMVRAAPLSEALVWTSLGWAFYFGTLFELSYGLELRVPFALLTATASVAALSALLPVTISGLGARELIYITVLGEHGVLPEKAAVLSLLHLFVMTASSTVFGLMGVAWRQRQAR